MMFAHTDDGARLEAMPGVRAICPACGARVIAKCGPIVTWHWAHEATDCDPFHEPETAWHREWKSRFAPDWCEQIVGPHRADVRLPNGHVLEFQHSSLSSAAISTREWFYGERQLCWVIDAQEFRQHLDLRSRRGRPVAAGEDCNIRWRWPRQSWFSARARLRFDLGDGHILLIRRLWPEVPCGAIGHLVTRRDWIARIHAAAAHRTTAHA